MSDSTKCPRCGGELPANFPPGVCPTCLLQQGLSPSTFLSGSGSASGDNRSGRRRSWTPPTPAELAPRFPQWEIVELLGQGGMGAVYKVRQRDLDRWAALKVLPDDVAHDPNFAERFQREARALALLGHQHIVIVYEFGQRDGVYFLLMEYIDGVTLRQAIRAGQVPAKDALGIVTQICDALQFAHEEGVIHRDIKPENILIDKRGRVKIADFGLAKLLGRAADVPALTGTHQVMGTPVYMAPEQMEGTRDVDHRADIFSLGVVFYELLTGELPLGRFAPPSQKYQLDVRLDEVVLRTLEKEPDRRYQQASDVKCDVESIRGELRAAASSAVEKPRSKWTPLKIVVAILLGLVGLFFVLMVSLIGVYFWSYTSPHSMSFETVGTENGSSRSAQRQAETQARYAEALQRQHAEPRGHQPSAVASQDPNEANAIIQFTAEGSRDGPDNLAWGTAMADFDNDGSLDINVTNDATKNSRHVNQAKLHPAFGTNVLTAEHRLIVNRILTTIHNAYLAVELRHTSWETMRDGTQVAVLEKFDDDISKLENELWTAIDSQLPVEQQKFLRLNLPIFADASQPLRQVFTDGMGSAGGPMGGGPAGSMSLGGGSGFVPPMAGGVGRWPTNLRHQQLLGWKRNEFPIRVSVGRRGKWYQWTIEYAQSLRLTAGVAPSETQPVVAVAELKPDYSVMDRGEDPEPPSGLRRFWRENATIEPKPTATKPPETPFIGAGETSSPFPPQTKSLIDELHALNNLRAAGQTPWDEVERRSNDLLTRFTAPANKGRIHWQAAHVYGQSDIRGHAADVTRHAKEALKYERDPVQRGWLFMYLGNAAEVRDNDPKSFIDRRTEATRWYLKGYAELLSFNLPNEAPELTGVGKIGDGFPGAPEGEIDPEQIAAEVRHAAQMRTRQEAEFVCALVERRNTYVGSLRELFVRLHEIYDKNSIAKERLREIANDVLRNPNEVEKLLNLMWPIQE